MNGHKYITKEWKNGRWVYYYVSPIFKDKTTISNTATYTNTKDPNDIRTSSSSTTTNLPAKRRINYLTKLAERSGLNAQTKLDNLKRAERYDAKDLAEKEYKFKDSPLDDLNAAVKLSESNSKWINTVSELIDTRTSMAKIQKNYKNSRSFIDRFIGEKLL